ncbi:hypothetical protein ACHQM5_016475 [Ranunculus cassubicifolius]
MWKKGGKRKGDDYDLSDDESPAKKYSKKKNASTTEDDSDAILVCELSAKRRVSVKSWKGMMMVEIREYYEKDGKQLPGKKGIMPNWDVSLSEWKVLRDHVDDIDKALAEKA